MKWQGMKGLSEDQRKQLKMAELKSKESQRRLEAELPDFKEEYARIVKIHKIRHRANISFFEGTPDWLKRMVLSVARPTLQLEECAEEVHQMENKSIEIENQAVDPND